MSRRLKSVIDLYSIQFRLTVGMVLAAVVGMGGLTGWTHWRMRQLLVENHKENAIAVAFRLSQDVDLYEKTAPLPAALSMAIAYREQPDVAIWIVAPTGDTIAQSKTLTMGSWQANGFTQALMAIVRKAPTGVQTVQLQNRYLVTCSSPLTVMGESIGQLYVVDDITEDKKSLTQITRTLALSSLLALGLGALAISFYIRQAMRPLDKLNRLAANVSANNLAATQLAFDRAPTEVKALAQTYNMMIARLSLAWEQQRRFVSDVSHELRTPLTLVQGYLQSTLRRSDNLSAPQREGLEIAADEADRTIRLLQDLLDLARADGGHLRFQIELEPLHSVVSEVLAMKQYGRDRIQANLQPVQALADRHRLKQVLINLMDNAMKYSDEGTAIEVRLRRVGNQAVLEVQDRGRGIPASDLDKIFDPFYRVDEDRSRTTGGTGLGLSIVKTLVEGMNGTLKVQSKLGEGSLFTVSLPLAQNKEISSYV